LPCSDGNLPHQRPAWEVEDFTSSCRRELEYLSARAQEEVLQAITRLEINPFGPPSKIKTVKGGGIGQWRLEVWPDR
jgi:mRNA-degrading endonuclease RelE of RelBE toxin-antitoxin system